MADDVIYSDSLVTIRDDSILFKSYGLLGGDKQVSFDEIEKIIVEKPTIWNGKYRYWGTGDFTTWFPLDFCRSKRDLIFVAYRRSKGGWRIGFTVEDSFKVADILQQKGLIHEIPEAVLAGTEKSGGGGSATRNLYLATVLLTGVVIPLILIWYFLIR